MEGTHPSTYLNRSVRLAATIRHLKPRQAYFRLYYRVLRRALLRRSATTRGDIVRRVWKQPWAAPAFGRAVHVDGRFEALGEAADVTTAADWNHPERSRLWTYNLHYLDDLGAQGADLLRQGFLIQQWIEQNPAYVGAGWEPYPLSLRLVNLVKWCSRHDPSRPDWLASIASQAAALAAQIEYHILANHLFANGKALIFVGAFFGGRAGEDWLAKGLRIIDSEIDEQFLDDGGHFERSPMYHAALLWDVCDLINLAQRSGLGVLSNRVAKWREVVVRGLSWLDTMSHPDGRIAFFNDAAFDIAPELADVAGYAMTLGLSREAYDRVGVAQHLASTGYVATSIPQHGKLILDVGEVGPDYQPGHAHADTLSFELSLFGQRVLVNSGISSYTESAERTHQRSTAAHNTVTVDGQDSSEVWAAFRVGRRARPFGFHVQESPGSLVVSCAHDGYRRLSRDVVHRRTWTLTGNSLRIADRIGGSFSEAVAHFHLHPAVRMINDGVIKVADRPIRWRLEDGTALISDTLWHPTFGASQPNKSIEIRFTGRELVTTFDW